MLATFLSGEIAANCHSCLYDTTFHKLCLHSVHLKWWTASVVHWIGLSRV